ncbi:hypothetical protein FVEG_17169 [Fusarium verticillioides 7600]|uniref:HNH nuclease domain-containing protein n=1 Tax=Gibberella moniliformis (strain M3125 / FGSC 7600) TaxID=334819 RepID=W7NB71_GIBM7|nr:hypothetical protein FVEG_17169 [Fusarium verticillioides 7600]EWG53747.1 hypothetical protein FVEG_17169 [Fusarium verticillioides 7600]
MTQRTQPFADEDIRKDASLHGFTDTRCMVSMGILVALTNIILGSPTVLDDCSGSLYEPPSDTDTSSPFMIVKKHDDMDMAEQKRCLNRDGNACVLTGSTKPSAYHVAPFSWNNTQENIKNTRKIGGRLGLIAGFGFVPRTSYLCDPESPGASDKAWNMISMDPQLYVWWCRGYSALRYLNMDPIGQHEMNITSEFRWMPQMKRYFGQETDVYNTGTGYNLQDLIDALHRFHDHGDPAPVADYKTRLRTPTNKGATLRSGKLIYTGMKREDTYRFRDMIDMQWGCILITALSSVTGSPQLLANKDSNDRVMQWVQDQARISRRASK